MYYNLRLWLLESSVRVNQWNMVTDIFGRLYKWKLDLTLHKPTLIAIYDTLSWFIQPIYQNYQKSQKFVGSLKN
jgi:hypothetical protein